MLPHLDAIYNFALRLTTDPNDAEDLVQDTIVKAFRFFNSYEKGTNAKAWLFRILKNSYINNYRKKSKNLRKLTTTRLLLFMKQYVRKEPKLPTLKIKCFVSLLMMIYPGLSTISLKISERLFCFAMWKILPTRKLLICWMFQSARFAHGFTVAETCLKPSSWITPPNVAMPATNLVGC